MNYKFKIKILTGIFTVLGLVAQMSNCHMSHAQPTKRTLDDRRDSGYTTTDDEPPRKIECAQPIFNTFLIRAVKNNDVPSARHWLIMGANPNTREQNTMLTALHLATIRNNLDMVELLISYRANPYATDNNGDTPLSYSLQYDATDVFEYLFTHYPPLPTLETSPAAQFLIFPPIA